MGNAEVVLPPQLSREDEGRVRQMVAFLLRGGVFCVVVAAPDLWLLPAYAT